MTPNANYGELLAEIGRLRGALLAARDELTRWGWGDFHYGPQQGQEQSVLDALAKIDRALAGKGRPSSSGAP